MGHIRGKGHHRTTASHSPVRALVVVLVIVAVLVDGDGRVRERMSDDGEPSGTAGKPILDVLRQGDLMNCAVTVTRYFGGILLGSGGLIRA